MISKNYSPQTEIQGFKDHRGYFDLIDDIKKLIVKSSLLHDFEQLKEGIKQLIIETCPYNATAQDDLKELMKQSDNLQSFFDENGKLKNGRDTRNNYRNSLKMFQEFTDLLRIKIYPQLARAKVMPYAEKTTINLSELEEDEDKKEELENLEKAGLI